MKILVAALHWGLGHAARCIPIVQTLQSEGHEILLASDGAALLLLQREFPTLKSFTLPAYDILYPSENMLWNMLSQNGKFRRAIRAEYLAIQAIVEDEMIDWIISDNRFGCHSPLAKKNIFVTHQINLCTGTRLGDWVASHLNLHLLRRFDEVWIPDEEDTPNLSGKLSHGRFTHFLDIHYIGVLSRFRQINNLKPIFFTEKNTLTKVLVVLSGPEPQRTYFEEKIIQQAKKINHNFLIVRGLVRKEPSVSQVENIKIYDFMDASKLNQAIQEADVVVSRSGYTTIMDLAILGKKALLIPTPGQTEQLYLAEHFSASNLFATQTQAKLDLGKGIEQAMNF